MKSGRQAGFEDDAIAGRRRHRHRLPNAQRRQSASHRRIACAAFMLVYCRCVDVAMPENSRCADARVDCARAAAALFTLRFIGACEAFTRRRDD